MLSIVYDTLTIVALIAGVLIAWVFAQIPVWVLLLAIDKALGL